VLAARLGVETAPFFVVSGDGGEEVVYRSALKLIKDHLTGGGEGGGGDLVGREPQEILRRGLERFGRDLAIAFSGAEDVALGDMAVRTGLPLSVVTVDTGRMHPETLEFVERVRTHYGVEIAVTAPDAPALEAFVREKGLFSFYEDGHAECCQVRKVEPLRRALSGYRAWATGQRRDQSLETRADLPVEEEDRTFAGVDGPLVKLNPLARWTADDVWRYLRDNGVPTNPLHERGYRSIGCAPCTRAIEPGQHEREGRWWWESAEDKECGLHAGNTRRS
jgi:thioredoxin-dependent adenylylsulfate APS reductase